MTNMLVFQFITVNYIVTVIHFGTRAFDKFILMPQRYVKAFKNKTVANFRNLSFVNILTENLQNISQA